MSRRDVRGAVVVITGGAGGLGSAMSRAFASREAQPVLLDVNAEGLFESTHPGFVCDLTDGSSVASVFAGVIDRFGGVDVLVNNAGLTHRSAFANTDPDVLRRVMDVNYFGAVNATKAALGSIVERRGAIVGISSVAGFAPLLGRSGYAASKHALQGFLGTLRTELSGTGVDITVVAPSFVDTPFRFRTLDADGSITTHPQSRVGRMMTADHVAEVVVRAVERRRAFVTVGIVGTASRILSRVSPRLYERIMTTSLSSELER
jgi:NAD(P)-dependent dehydrogenase (short-subunit alcohol dehydrogenase family)